MAMAQRAELAGKQVCFDICFIMNTDRITKCAMLVKMQAHFLCFQANLCLVQFPFSYKMCLRD